MCTDTHIHTLVCAHTQKGGREIKRNEGRDDGREREKGEREKGERKRN